LDESVGVERKLRRAWHLHRIAGLALGPQLQQIKVSEEMRARRTQFIAAVRAWLL
jgi:hypothetical protein